MMILSNFQAAAAVRPSLFFPLLLLFEESSLPPRFLSVFFPSPKSFSLLLPSNFSSLVFSSLLTKTQGGASLRLSLCQPLPTGLCVACVHKSAPSAFFFLNPPFPFPPLPSHHGTAWPKSCAPLSEKNSRRENMQTEPFHAHAYIHRGIILFDAAESGRKETKEQRKREK